MGVILRVSGVNFDVDACLRECQLETYGAHRKGETYGKRGRVRQHSGFGVDVSQVDWDDLRGQIADAILFLKAHREELRKLLDFPGIEGRTLDFPIWERDAAVQFDYFPPQLLRLAGELEIGIELSRYATSDENDDT